MESTQTLIRRAASNVGGVKALADKLGVTRAAIYAWSRIPAERVIPVEALTGISRHELRPDLYPE